MQGNAARALVYFLWEAFRAPQPSERDSKLSKATESHRQELGSANQGPSGDFMVPQMGPSRHSSDSSVRDNHPIGEFRNVTRIPEGNWSTPHNPTSPLYRQGNAGPEGSDLPEDTAPRTPLKLSQVSDIDNLARQVG